MILSIDGGATKTCAILFDEADKTFLSSGISGPSNFLTVSQDVSEDNINDAMDQALTQAGMDLSQVRYVILGIAGAGDSKEATALGNRIVRNVMGNHPYTLENDGYLAYRMSNMFQDGIIFAPGTGSVGFYQKEGKINRIGGWGWFAGDEGSASWMAKRCITLAQRQKDGILQGDSLVKLVEEYFQNDFRDVMGSLEGKKDKRHIALLAPRISTMASSGDETALSILQEAGEYAASVINAAMVNFRVCPEVSVLGGTVRSGKFFTNTITANSRCRPKFFYGYHVCVGGIVIGSREMGLQLTAKDRDFIISQLEADIKRKPAELLRDSLGFI
ncbi:N-acetylglucosamine kinase [Oxyplasma meridianum]|uniref:N-acetylglucosamine kinase n=1 Tax=Oxyplasma meridianum TaxID=3073602 RepID=A0AAX4NFN9_9ARCH